MPFVFLPLAFFSLSPAEIMVVGVVAVLLFGSKLPSVARSMGKSMTEFKRGMQDVERDVKTAIYHEPAGEVGYDASVDEVDEPDTPRFEPPTTPPRAEQPVAEQAVAEQAVAEQAAEK